jgi:hypothetical protein
VNHSLQLDLLFFLSEASEAVPFNYLELFLFVQNIFLCMFSTEKDNLMMEVFFAIATIILVYFIIFQTLFAQQTLNINRYEQQRSNGGQQKRESLLNYEDWFDIGLDESQEIEKNNGDVPGNEQAKERRLKNMAQA